MKIFLTGGTGFIGSYITRDLITRGHHVTILARNINKIPHFQNHNRIHMVEGNITDRETIKNALSGMDICIHNALSYSTEKAWEVMEQDTLPSLFLAETAAESGVNQFIYTSSTSVNDYLYQGFPLDGKTICHIDTSTRHTPMTYYGATKAAVENYLIALSYQRKMRVNIIRPGYVFGDPLYQGGTGQSDSRFLDMVEKARANQPIYVKENDGTQFIWAGDLARLYGDVAESPENRKVYFALSPQFISWQDIAEMVIKLTDSASLIQIESSNMKQPLQWDVSAIHRDFGHCFQSMEHLENHILHLNYGIE